MSLFHSVAVLLPEEVQDLVWDFLLPTEKLYYPPKTIKNYVDEHMYQMPPNQVQQLLHKQKHFPHRLQEHERQFLQQRAMQQFQQDEMDKAYAKDPWNLSGGSMMDFDIGSMMDARDMQKSLQKLRRQDWRFLEEEGSGKKITANDHAENDKKKTLSSSIVPPFPPRKKSLVKKQYQYELHRVVFVSQMQRAAGLDAVRIKLDGVKASNLLQANELEMVMEGTGLKEPPQPFLTPNDKKKLQEIARDVKKNLKESEKEKERQAREQKEDWAEMLMPNAAFSGRGSHEDDVDNADEQEDYRPDTKFPADMLLESLLSIRPSGFGETDDFCAELLRREGFACSPEAVAFFDYTKYVQPARVFVHEDQKTAPTCSRNRNFYPKKQTEVENEPKTLVLKARMLLAQKISKKCMDVFYLWQHQRMKGGDPDDGYRVACEFAWECYNSFGVTEKLEQGFDVVEVEKNATVEHQGNQAAYRLVFDVHKGAHRASSPGADVENAADVPAKQKAALSETAVNTTSAVASPSDHVSPVDEAVQPAGGGNKRESAKTERDEETPEKKKESSCGKSKSAAPDCVGVTSFIYPVAHCVTCGAGGTVPGRVVKNETSAEINLSSNRTTHNLISPLMHFTCPPCGKKYAVCDQICQKKFWKLHKQNHDKVQQLYCSSCGKEKDDPSEELKKFSCQDEDFYVKAPQGLGQKSFTFYACNKSCQKSLWKKHKESGYKALVGFSAGKKKDQTKMNNGLFAPNSRSASTSDAVSEQELLFSNAGQTRGERFVAKEAKKYWYNPNFPYGVDEFSATASIRSLCDRLKQHQFNCSNEEVKYRVETLGQDPKRAEAEQRLSGYKEIEEKKNFFMKFADYKIKVLQQPNFWTFQVDRNLRYEWLVDCYRMRSRDDLEYSVLCGDFESKDHLWNGVYLPYYYKSFAGEFLQDKNLFPGKTSNNKKFADADLVNRYPDHELRLQTDSVFKIRVNQDRQLLVKEFLKFTKLAKANNALFDGFSFKHYLAAAEKILMFPFCEKEAIEKYGEENMFLTHCASLRRTATWIYQSAEVREMPGEMGQLDEQLERECAAKLNAVRFEKSDREIFEDVGGKEIWVKLWKKLKKRQMCVIEMER